MTCARAALRNWMLIAAAGCTSLVSCQTNQKHDAAVAAAGSSATAQSGAVDVSFLVSMTWNEAKKLSAQQLEIPPYYKVAADEVRVLQTDASGRPLRVRAKGHVFMQVDFEEQMKALGQEAYIKNDGELILRGKPLLNRGRSL